jgi:pimeloyl-ACP methyl ester carboxylesterase
MHRFPVAGGQTVAADIGGDAHRPAIVLMHGGGQTRHSWHRGLEVFVGAGYHVVALDARGHGDSDWSPTGDYGLTALVSDLSSVLEQLTPDPVLVGASLGGMTALAAVGEGAVRARALVLVDITPRIDTRGTDYIAAFMNANLSGFATLDEAADAVARYNPHRPRPRNVSGLMRNLRERNGRLYWHWDPRFLSYGELHPDIVQPRLEAAARRVTVPTLLIRGGQSDVVGDAEVAHFQALVPEAECATVGGAGHMVAGDRNDAFNQGILDFISRLAIRN